MTVSMLISLREQGKSLIKFIDKNLIKFIDKKKHQEQKK